MTRQYTESLNEWAALHAETIEHAAPEPDHCRRHQQPLTWDGYCPDCDTTTRTQAAEAAARYWAALDHADRRDAAWEAHYEQAENDH